MPATSLCLYFKRVVLPSLLCYRRQGRISFQSDIFNVCFSAVELYGLENSSQCIIMATLLLILIGTDGDLVI